MLGGTPARVELQKEEPASTTSNTFSMNPEGFETPIIPFFWTVLYGRNLKYCGSCKLDDNVKILCFGNVAKLNFVAYFCRGETVE